MDDGEESAGAEEDEDNEVNDNDTSSADDYFDMDEVSEFSDENSSDDGSEYTLERHHSGGRIRKRKRDISLYSRDSSLDAVGESLRNKKSLIVTFQVPPDGLRAACDPNQRDDDEDLPGPPRARSKNEKPARLPSSNLRQITLDDLGVRSALHTNGNPRSPSVNHGTANTQRGANRNASSPFSTALTNAPTFPLPTPPSEHQQSRYKAPRVEVDLTAEPDEKPVIIKGEPVDHMPVNQRSQATVTTPAADDDDSDDLQDELRQIEIRRKLRAKKKQKRAAGQTAL